MHDLSTNSTGFIVKQVKGEGHYPVEVGSNRRLGGPFATVAQATAHGKQKARPPVTRLVRPRCHIGSAYGGDMVRLDAAELDAPAIAAALWTEEEARAAAKALEEKRAALWRDEPSGAMRATDAALAAAVAQRREQAEAERRAAPEQ